MDARDRVHVDRAREVATFREMLAGGRPQILLIQADGGMGKSELLVEFQAQAENAPTALLPLVQRTAKASDILHALVRRLGVDVFPTYTSQHDEFTKRRNVQISDIRMWQSQINVTDGVGDEDNRTRVLMNAFFEDANRIATRRVVIMLDAFEQASDIIQEWISGPFLDEVRARPRIAVVVAGRSVPKLPNDLNLSWALTEVDPLDQASVVELARRRGLELTGQMADVVIDSTDGGIPLKVASAITRRLLRLRESG